MVADVFKFARILLECECRRMHSVSACLSVSAMSVGVCLSMFMLFLNNPKLCLSTSNSQSLHSAALIVDHPVLLLTDVFHLALWVTVHQAPRSTEELIGADKCWHVLTIELVGADRN